VYANPSVNLAIFDEFRYAAFVSRPLYVKDVVDRLFNCTLDSFGHVI